MLDVTVVEVGGGCGAELEPSSLLAAVALNNDVFIESITVF